MNGKQIERSTTVLILGAGPGGLQLGYLLGRAGIDYLILERAPGAGSFFERQPVHRRLISVNKIHTGTHDPDKRLRWDWNSLLCDDPRLQFANYDRSYYPDADSMVRYLDDFCRLNRLNVLFETTVASVGRRGREFELRAQNGGVFRAPVLVVATGVGEPRLPAIPGLEADMHYARLQRSTQRFVDKRVLIIGKGNSAFETADSLTQDARSIHLISPGYLRSAAWSHFLGDPRHVNDAFLDTFFLKQQNAALNGTILRIEGRDDGYSVTVKYTENDEVAQLPYDEIIACTGFKFDDSIFAPDCKPALTHEDSLPALTCEWESVNIPNAFFVGTLMQANDYRRSSSAFIGGIRYNARVLARILQGRLGRPQTWPRAVDASTDVLFDEIYQRIETCSSLWHLFSTLCDVYAYRAGSGVVDQYFDVPTRMVAEHDTFKGLSGFTFQFGYKSLRHKAGMSGPYRFIHPIVGCYEHGELIEECEFVEDVYADWTDREEFGAPLRATLSRHLARMASPSRKSKDISIDSHEPIDDFAPRTELVSATDESHGDVEETDGRSTAHSMRHVGSAGRSGVERPGNLPGGNDHSRDAFTSHE